MLVYANITKKRCGTLFRVFMLGYMAMRLSIEFIEPTYNPYGGLSAIQVACVVGMGMCGWWLLRRKTAEPSAMPAVGLEG